MFVLCMMYPFNSDMDYEAAKPALFVPGAATWQLFSV